MSVWFLFVFSESIVEGHREITPWREGGRDSECYINGPENGSNFLYGRLLGGSLDSPLQILSYLMD